MVSTKWTYHKAQSLASNYFVFFKFYFCLRTSYKLYKELIWCSNHTNDYIQTFQKRWSFIWGRFSLWVSLNENVLWRTEDNFLEILSYIENVLKKQETKSRWAITPLN